MTLQGTKNLENWCKHVTDGKVNIVNMSTSWRSGLGFCAIIHHFRPDLVDFENLDPEDVYGNNELAFRVAEAHLGIPALLDPADMLECSIPDRLSILTYLSQFYHAFHTSNLKHKKMGGSQSSSEASTPSKSLSSNTTSTMLRSRAKESCNFCNKPVFILERINIAGHLLHRTCFKCRRCDAQLSVVNFYETENGEYCCDMCPDEEKNHVEVTTANKRIVEDWSSSGDNQTKTTNATDEDRAQNNETSIIGQADNEIKTTTSNTGQADNGMKTTPSDIGQTDNENNNMENTSNIEHNNMNNNLQNTENISTSSLSVTSSEIEFNKEVQSPLGTDAGILRKEDVTAVGQTDDERQGLVSARVSLFESQMVKAESKEDIENNEHENLVEISNQQPSSSGETSLQQSLEPPDGSEPVDDSLNGDMENDQVDDSLRNGDTASEKVDPVKTSENLGIVKTVATEIPEISEPVGLVVASENSDIVKPVKIPEISEPIYLPVVVKEDQLEEKEICEAEEEIYPDDLNPFGEEEEENKKTEEEIKNVSSNPFGSDGEDEEARASPMSPNSIALSAKGTPLVGPPKPPRISLNPFGSDCEDDDEETVRSRPKPPSSPNLSKHPPSPTLSCMSGTSSRKKRPAPLPPGKKIAPTPSPRTSLRTEVRRSAPPRPPLPSPAQPKERKERENLNRRSQQMLETASITSFNIDTTADKNDSAKLTALTSKTAAIPSDIVLNQLPPNKASEGVWKKKKGPAPPRPIPPKLQVKKLPRKAVNQELHDIEVKQQELERQGVKLEKTIRELCKKSDSERLEKGLDNNDRDSLGPEAEDLIMQLFELVNEKNDLYRRQTELMYMKREHRLEEEHADIEYQIRVLMSKAETLRTDDEKLKEEKLISRLMEIVAQRNEIVDCLEMDRLRELEEDESIEVHMGEFAAVRPPEGEEKTKKKKKEKEKKKKKKDKEVDDDKDIDTSENAGATPKSSPKKGLMSAEKDLAKKMKKKLMSTLKPVVMHHKK